MLEQETLDRLIKTLEDSNKKTVEEANRKQSEELKQNIKEEVHEIKLHFEEELNKKNAELEKKYQELKIKYEKLEKEQRKNNIIIFGLDSPGDNLCNFVISEINQRLALSLTINDINNVYTIGKQSTKKPIIVKLLSYMKKVEIFKNSRELKGTGISIADDLTIEERAENKILRQHLKKARSKKFNAFIKNRRLIINGEHYNAQQLVDEEEDTDTEDVKLLDTKEDEEVFETKKLQDFTKKKTPKINQSGNAIIRTSNRINSNREQKKNNITTNTNSRS